MIDHKNTISHKTDEELVGLVLQNQDNFLYIMERYQDKLSRYIYRISGICKEDIEDALQEVFIKVYQNLNDFDTSLKFSSWIYRIAHNHVISHHRKVKARPTSVSYDDDPVMINKLVAETDVLKEISAGQNKEVVRRVLVKMEEKYREVLILKFIEEKDYNEISDILQKPIGTVGTLINRAKKQFKEIVEKERVEF